MVKIVGMPAVFWIGSVWEGVWTAFLIVLLLSIVFLALAYDSSHSGTTGGGRATRPSKWRRSAP